MRVNEGGWSLRTATFWERSLKQHVYPKISKLKVHEIETKHIISVLEPMWSDQKFEAAAKVRTRIENILSWSQVKGFIPDPHRPNPARLDGNIEHLIPQRTKKSKNHEALPYAEIPALMSRLRDDASMGSFALRFLILTAVRLNEAREATWGEIDLEGRLWTIGAARMKMDRDHQVPLSDACIEILREVRKLYGDAPESHNLVFPGARGISACATINNTLKAIHPDVTVHGMRSSFRDWCGDCTSFPREIAEAALAHIVGGVEGDYRRGTALAKRRELMAQWADFAVGTPRGEVIPLRA
jgi:integrase